MREPPKFRHSVVEEWDTALTVFNKNYEKVMLTLGLMTAVDPQRLSKEGSKIERILLEMATVFTASTWEAYLHEKFREVLIYKGQGANDEPAVRRVAEAIVSRDGFSDVIKARRTFRNILEIDLFEGLERDATKALRILMEKRHAIVHRGGEADRKLVELCEGAVSLKEVVPLDAGEIRSVLKTMGGIAAKLELKFRGLPRGF